MTKALYKGFGYFMIRPYKESAGEGVENKLKFASSHAPQIPGVVRMMTKSLSKITWKILKQIQQCHIFGSEPKPGGQLVQLALLIMFQLSASLL